MNIELSNGLYCFCTDTYDSMLLCSLFMREWTFLQLQVTLAKSLPVHPTSAPPTSIIPASYTRPITVLVAPRRVMMMMMMMMSPLCLSLVLIVFLKFVCRPSWLAVLLCEVLALLKKHVKKGMQPRCWTKKKKRHDGKRAMPAGGLWDLRWWQSMYLVSLSQFLL